jgi:ABC-type sugar transport system ATPase subunit
VTALQTQNEQLARAQSTSGISKVLQDLEDVPAMTDEEKREFAESGPFIQKVVKQSMAAVIKPLVDQINALSTAVGKVDLIDKQMPELARARRRARGGAPVVRRDRARNFQGSPA